MKVLVVLSQPPTPEGGAPGRCAIALLRGLRSHGIDVRAVAPRRHFTPPGDPPSDLDVEVIPVDEHPSRLAITANRIRRPRGELARGAFAAAVRERARDVDVLHLEETETAWCDLGIAKPAVVHLHYLVRRDRPFELSSFRLLTETIEFACGEHAAVRRHRHLVASSPLIADELSRRRPDGDVVLAPLSLDPDGYPAAPLEGPPAIGLIGAAAWPQTAAAIRRLVDEVWPRIHALVPQARLHLAGRGVEGLGLSPAPGLELAGEVASGVEFLRGLSALVFPLDRGSGMKVKVLESVAVGLPVVTTPAGAEGIEAGEGIAVGRSDEELAALAAAILGDAAERRRRGTAGREAFLKRYTPGAATAPLVPLYERMSA